MIDLHLVSWNRPKMTELVVKAIHRNTTPGSFRLVVLDNGSSGETPDHLQQLADNGFIDEFIPIKTNIGLEAARNLLLQQATSTPRFVCIDNDCLPAPPTDTDWLAKLNDLMDKYEDYAAIAARTFPMIGTGNIFEEADRAGHEIVDFPHPGGSYRIMDTGVVNFVGGWDRQAPGRGSEETYIGEKLQKAGFKTAFATNILTLHLFGDQQTDNWGYNKQMKPEESGHSSGVWHPKFAEGDNPEEVEAYAGKELTAWYLSS